MFHVPCLFVCARQLKKRLPGSLGRPCFRRKMLWIKRIMLHLALPVSKWNRGGGVVFRQGILKARRVGEDKCLNQISVPSM